MSNTFLKKATLFALVSAYRSICLVILMPIWTLYLNPDEIGMFSIVMTYSLIMARIGSFGLNASFSRFYIDYESNLKRYSSFFSSVGLSLLLITMVLNAILYSIKDSLSLVLFGNESGDLFIYSWGFYLTTLITSLSIAMFVVRGEAVKAFKVTVLPQTIGIAIGLYALVFHGGGLFERLNGVIIGEIISAALCIWLLLKNFSSRAINASDVKEAWYYGVPLMIHSLSVLLLQSGDRILLLEYCSAGDVGKYTIATSFVAGLLMLQGAANQVWAPNFIRLMRERETSTNNRKAYDHLFQKSFEIWMVGFSFISLFLVIFGKELVELMTSDELYLQAYLYITPLAIGCLLTGAYFYGINIIMYTKRNKLVPVITLLACLLNILLNIYLLPIFGPVAAAWTTLLCNAFLLVSVHYYAKHISGIRYNYRTFTFVMCAVGLVSLLCRYIDYNIQLDFYLLVIVKFVLLVLSGLLFYKIYCAKLIEFKLLREQGL